MEPESPAWLEVNVVLWDADTQRFHDLLLGDGHAQLRTGDAYDPPYYEIDGAEDLYTDLDKYHVQGVPFIFYLENGSIVDILRISDIENQKKTLAEMYPFFGKDRTKEAPTCVADSIEFSA